MLVKLALTGKPKSGKTTAILKLVDSLLQHGIKVRGFYTVEVKKTEYMQLDFTNCKSYGKSRW